MQTALKTISWIVLGVLVTIMTAAYVCPMSMYGNSAEAGSSPSLCHQSIGPVGANTGGITGCAGSHLAAIGQLLGDIPQVMNLLLALGSLAAVYHLLTRRCLSALIRPLFSRLRHFYLYYCTSIKSLIERKLLRYLNLLGHFTVASPA